MLMINKCKHFVQKVLFLLENDYLCAKKVLNYYHYYMLYYHLDGSVEAFTAGRNDALPYPVIQGHQIHEDRIAVIDKEFLDVNPLSEISFTSTEVSHHPSLEGFDAFVTSLPEVAIAVRTADCVPVLLYDQRRKVVAAVHSGWRSTVKRISQKTLHLMSERFGSEPEDVIAIIGPCICHDSYQVGEEVIEDFRKAGFDDCCWTQDAKPADNKYHLDLWRANSMLLVEAGVKEENIHLSGICTFMDENYYSARREGNKHDRRNINAIKLLSDSLI